MKIQSFEKIPSNINYGQIVDDLLYENEMIRKVISLTA